MLTVTEDHIGRRIDNVLVSVLKGVPKSRIYRMLRTGEVRVNGGRVKHTYRLQRGDSLRLPPVVSTRSAGGELIVHARLRSRLMASILYEDRSVLILNKPAGIPVHAGSGLRYGVIEALRAIRPEAAFLELVHRLDRHTSGCLMIAKRSRHLRQLHEALQNNRVEKWYLALVDGSWLQGARLINSKIRKNLLRSGERMVDVSAHGKESLTWMMPQERFREATLMKVRPLTGRTHQIRVHAAHSGHPVAGDEKYGHPDFNEKMHTLGLRRLFLHASELHLRLPGSGRVIHVEAPLPGPLLGVVARLRAEQVDQGQRLGVR